MKKITIPLCLAVMLLCSALIAGCGGAVIKDEATFDTAGLTFLKTSEVTDKSQTDALGALPLKGDAYVCFIDGNCPKKVTVPSEYDSLPVVALFGDGAECKKLKKLTVGEGVLLIDSLFADGNDSLASVTLPAGTLIIKNSFRKCSALEEVNIGGLSGEVRDSFCDLSAMKYLTVGDVEGASLIDSFEKCGAIEKIEFTGTFDLEKHLTEDKENYVNAFLFNDSKTLREVVFGGRVKTVPESFCSGCEALESVTFRGTVELVSYMAFHDCESLTNLVFEEGVETIGEHAFGGCGFETLSFGGNVGKISGYSFQSCDDLVSLKFEGDVGELEDCFALCKKLETVDFGGAANTVSGALCKCPVLKKVTFGGDVDTIDGSFKECPELVEVVFEGKVREITYGAFNSSDKVELTGLSEDVIFGTDELSQRFDAAQQKFKEYYDKINAWSENDLEEWIAEHAAGRTLDAGKEIGIDEAKNYAGVLNGPIVYNYKCTDCPYDDYCPDAAKENELFTDMIKDIKKDHPDTVYTDEKALAVAKGEAPLVIAFAESMGYIPIEYIDRDNGGYTETIYYEMMRVSFWNIETGELVAWYQHRDGEAPAEYSTSDRGDYVYTESYSQDRKLYFFEGGYVYPEAMLWETVFPGSN